MQKSISRIFLILMAGVFLPLLSHADPATEAAGRIKDRLAQVDTLKESGAVGETATGFLESRQTLEPAQQSLVDAENADRRVIYASIARRTGQSYEEVGLQRALQIASRARPGVWLQKSDGEWYQK